MHRWRPRGPAFLLVGLLTAGFAGWILATRWDPALPYLPAWEGQGWWVPPRTASAEMHRQEVRWTCFRARFELDQRPDGPVLLEVAAFRQAAVWVNEQPVPELRVDPTDWKRRRAADVAPRLRPGSNEVGIWVTNMLGPPALWARWESPVPAALPKLHWEVISAGAEPQPARAAHIPLPVAKGSYLDGQVPLPHLLRSAWKAWMGMAVGSGLLAAVGFLAGRFLEERLKQAWDRLLPAMVLGGSAVVWLGLFVNNLPQLPRIYGFDAEGHEQYIRLVQEEGRLPLADEGWQMYQPPLYYVLAAALLELCGLTVAEDTAVAVLRGFNGLLGWLHVAAVFWLLRLLFPQEGWKAAVGALLVSALPAHLLLSHYVTNEPLAALGVTVALALALKAARSPRPIGPAIGAGVALGLSLLTKFSTLLAMPIVLGLLWQGEPHAGKSARVGGGLPAAGALRVLSAALTAALVCGWHYLRVWWHFGKPLVGNWDLEAWAHWWQDPGYRTAWDYLRFGGVFVEPWFSGFRSFWDGLYATLWGDGLASSAAWMAFRPPWNESWMAVTWWLSAVWTVSLLVGAGVLAWRWVRHGDEAGWVGPGLLALFLWGLLYMSVRVPSYAQVKAFYALPALAGLAVVVVTGWERLAGTSRIRHGLLTTLLLVWCGSSWSAFFVRASHPQTMVVQGIWALDQGDVAAAARRYGAALAISPRWPPLADALAQAVRVRPREPIFRDLYATCLEAHGQWREAVDQRRAALTNATDRPELLNNLAWLLATVPVEELRQPAEAVALARQACELTRWAEPQFLGTLAAALAAAGRFAEAVQTAEEAIRLAREQNRSDLVTFNQNLLELYRSGRSYRMPAP
jgi:Tfp pilus assembly protein PilF